MCHDNLRGFCRVQWLYVARSDADGRSKRYRDADGSCKRFRNGCCKRFGNADRVAKRDRV